MGMLMIKCPQTGRAIATGIKSDRDSFLRSTVFFARTPCPICRTDHGWFAPEAWVQESDAESDAPNASAPISGAARPQRAPRL